MTRLSEQKNKYKLGLRTGGLMECPEWEIQDIREIYANSLEEAKDKWAIATGLANSPHWNKTNKTFWGWEVVQI